MKNKYLNYLLLIILMFFSFYIYKNSFEYKAPQNNSINRQNIPLNRIVFTNGVELAILKSKNLIDAKALVQNGRSEKVIFEDDFVSIDAVFPDSDSAKAALVSHQCSGSSCENHPSYLAVPEGDDLNTYFISDFPFKFKPEFLNTKLISAPVKMAIVGQDIYGSAIHGDLTFVPGQGFVISTMKDVYVSLLNQHPYNYFENKIAREPLIKTVGLEKFREIRQYMEVGSGAQLIDYRYLAFISCKAHYCADCFGVIIVDTVTDDLWWLTVKDKNQQSGTTKTMSSNEVLLFKEIVRKIKFTNGSALDLDSKGRLVVKIK